MGNLKQFQGKSTVDLIVEYHKKRGDFEPVRGYLGASIVGHECERYLWYCFRLRPVFRTSVAVSIGSSRQAT
jgi:hypothetical protein